MIGKRGVQQDLEGHKYIYQNTRNSFLLALKLREQFHASHRPIIGPIAKAGHAVMRVVVSFCACGVELRSHASGGTSPRPSPSRSTPTTHRPARSHTNRGAIRQRDGVQFDIGESDWSWLVLTSHPCATRGRSKPACLPLHPSPTKKRRNILRMDEPTLSPKSPVPVVIGSPALPEETASPSYPSYLLAPSRGVSRCQWDSIFDAYTRKLQVAARRQRL